MSAEHILYPLYEGRMLFLADVQFSSPAISQNMTTNKLTWILGTVWCLDKSEYMGGVI